MIRIFWVLTIFSLAGSVTPCHAQQPFLTETQWVALREAADGGAPFEALRRLTQLHRVPATAAFDQAADFIRQNAIDDGLQQVQTEQFPIDGKRHYGLMRSHLGWQMERGLLWQVTPSTMLLADEASDPIRLADYSHSATVTSSLIDVGDGTHPEDYEGKDIRGKIVLADGVLSAVQRLAVSRYGAAGIVSDMPNQTTAWSGLDDSLVRWGHLDASEARGFAFMVSRATAAALRRQLATGEKITLRAEVKAEVGPGHWTVVTGVIPGSDPAAGEIVYSCHLDHERPGANDNGSGCVTILESARLLSRLIASGALTPPRRTLRFIWGPEVEGTMAYLSQHPERRRAMRADIHMDMVGGDPFKNKSILHVTQTPWSLPSFVTDIGTSFATLIKDGATAYSEDGGHAEAAVLDLRPGGNGTRNAFLVDETPYAEGSDHDDYDSSTIAVPSLYLRDWPDIYIHTDHDSLEQIDATKLRRVALLGAAAGYSFASLDASDLVRVLPFLATRAQQRLAQLSVPAQRIQPFEARNLIDQALLREQASLASLVTFTGGDPSLLAKFDAALARQAAELKDWVGVNGAAPPSDDDDPDAALIPKRIGDFGPLTYQNDDVLQDRLGRDRVAKILLFAGGASRFMLPQDKGSLYAYEIINFVDGRRSVRDIRNAVAAEFGPIPVAVVADYLRACITAGVIAR